MNKFTIIKGNKIHTLATDDVAINFDEVIFDTASMRDVISLRQDGRHKCIISEISTNSFLEQCHNASIKVLDKRTA